MKDHDEGEPIQSELPGMPEPQKKGRGILHSRGGPRTLPTIRDYEQGRVQPENLTRMRRINDMLQSGMSVEEVNQRIGEELASEAETEHELTPELPGLKDSGS